MNKLYRKITVTSIITTFTLVIFLAIGNSNSHAAESIDEEEIEAAILAFESMDEQSQQQMLASMNVSPQSSLNLSGLDLETALMIVQQNRTNILDSELRDQFEKVQKMNEQYSNISQAYVIINKEINAFEAGEKITNQKAFDLFRLFCIGQYGDYNDFINLILSGDFPDNAPLDENLLEIHANRLNNLSVSYMRRNNKSFKIELDRLYNAHEMDTLRLLAMSQKRNEAFDLMTNFIKKMQDSRSFLLENIR